MSETARHTEASARPDLYVVTPCRNAQDTLSDTLETLEGQEAYWTHHFIIDGASTDATLAIAQVYADRHPTKVTIVSETDQGIYEAMNKGIRLALERACDSDLIAVNNADDSYLPTTLRLVVETATAYPQVAVIYGDVMLADSTGLKSGAVRRSAPVLPATTSCLEMPLEHPTMFVRAHLYCDLGLYDEGYAIASDFEWVLRLIESNASVLYLAKPLVLFRTGGISTSRISESFREMMRARIAHGSNPVFEYLRYGRMRFLESLYTIARLIPGFESWYARRKGR